MPPTTAEMELIMTKTAKKARADALPEARCGLSAVPKKKSSSASGASWRRARRNAAHVVLREFVLSLRTSAFTLMARLLRWPRTLEEGVQRNHDEVVLVLPEHAADLFKRVPMTMNSERIGAQGSPELD